MRVSSLAAVEAFYERLAARLGLTRKTYSVVDENGDWHPGSPERYNVVEFTEADVHGRLAGFFGVIEEADAQPARSRIAFAVAEGELDEWQRALHEIGARDVERSEDDGYPAVFFCDPLGTRLEVVARRVR